MSRKHAWKEITRKSKAEDPYDRIASLASATGQLEVALSAMGIPKDRKSNFLKQRLKKFLERGNPPKGWPRQDDLNAAIEARNAAVHDYTKVPNTKDTQAHVKILHRAWGAMQLSFVTPDKAKELARKFLTHNRISKVALFGSLTQSNKTHREDIDLILLDDGEFSWMALKYPLMGFRSITDIMEDAGRFEEKDFPIVRAAVECGWLDILVINDLLFETNVDYVRNLCKAQHDPLFFLKVAAAMKVYEPDTDRWTGEKPRHFARLAQIYEDLVLEGIL